MDEGECDDYDDDDEEKEEEEEESFDEGGGKLHPPLSMMRGKRVVDIPIFFGRRPLKLQKFHPASSIERGPTMKVEIVPYFPATSRLGMRKPSEAQR